MDLSQIYDANPNCLQWLKMEPGCNMLWRIYFIHTPFFCNLIGLVLFSILWWLGSFFNHRLSHGFAVMCFWLVTYLHSYRYRKNIVCLICETAKFTSDHSLIWFSFLNITANTIPLVTSYYCDRKLRPTGVMMKRNATFGPDSPYSVTSRGQRSVKSAANPMKTLLSKALSRYNQPQFADEHLHH